MYTKEFRCATCGPAAASHARTKNQRNCKKHMYEDLTKVLGFAKNVLATLNAFLNKGE